MSTKLYSFFHLEAQGLQSCPHNHECHDVFSEETSAFDGPAQMHTFGEKNTVMNQASVLVDLTGEDGALGDMGDAGSRRTRAPPAARLDSIGKRLQYTASVGILEN